MKRPVSVLMVSYLYIAVGVIGFAYHFPQLIALERYAVWIELTELLAIISGAFMLLSRNWARWLALAWMAFHVAISIPVLRQAAIHFLFFAVIAWFLFRSNAMQYFRTKRAAGNELDRVSNKR
jgi:hypothetical protein